MNSQWNEDFDTVFVKEKLSNGQVMILKVEMTDYNLDTNYWNISAAVYNKRKDINSNETNKLITGNTPFEVAILAMKAFPILENEILTLYSGYNNVIMCCGSDLRRNRVYYKYLSKRGYKYNNFCGNKYIMKTFKKED